MELAAILLFTTFLVLALLSPKLISSHTARQTQRLATIERKLQLLMDHLGVVDQVPGPPEVVCHINAGNKIAAIKAYRDATGANLKEAKKAVEDITLHHWL